MLELKFIETKEEWVEELFGLLSIIMIGIGSSTYPPRKDIYILSYLSVTSYFKVWFFSYTSKSLFQDILYINKYVYDYININM